MSRLERRLSNQKKQQNKRIVSVIVALAMFAAAAGASYYWFSNHLFELSREAGGFLTAQNKMTILVMGVDERADDVGRSDTMFVVTVDTNTKEVAMLSVPRDTRVKIPGHGYDKINHAYAYGGHKLAQQAVEGLLGIKIDHYVLVNFSAFHKIVDAVGGVDIDVEKRMYYEDPWDDGGLVINLQPGLQHMDGKTAIQYVRYRDAEGDIGRVQRQQKFIKALMKEVTSPAVIPRIPAIIQQVSAALKTDMSTTDMLGLAKIMNDAYKNGLKTDMVPGKPAYIAEVSYWLPDVLALRQHVAQTLGVTMEDKYLAVTRREAAEYETSIPKEMKIVETPKVTTKPDTADKPKTTDPAQPAPRPVAPAKPSATPPAPAKIRVEVVNASGNADAGRDMAEVLRSQGFEVVSVSNLTSSYKNTVVISNTTNSAVVNKLTGLPFQYALQVTKDESKSAQATVVVGKDYAK